MKHEASQMPDAFLLAVIFEGGLGLLAVGLGWLLGYPPADLIQWDLDSVIWGVFATLPLIGVIWLAIRTEWRLLRHVLQVVKDQLLPLLSGCGPIKLAIIALFAGFGEEMLFRGVLQNWVADFYPKDLGAYIGLIVASVIFGIVHWVTVAYAVLAMLIGLYLGVLWMLFGNLLVPALVHSLYDFWAMLYLIGHAESQQKNS